MKLKRLFALVSFALVSGWTLQASLICAQGESTRSSWIPVRSWRFERQVDYSNAQVRLWAQHIRSATQNPFEQAALAEQVVAHKIAYTSESPDRTPTLDEILTHPSGNCVAQAIALASLFEALGLKAEILTRPDHAWVSVEVGPLRFSALPQSMAPALAFLCQNPRTCAVCAQDSILTGCFKPVAPDINHVFYVGFE